MARTFAELRAKMSDESRAPAQALHDIMAAEPVPAMNGLHCQC